MYRALWNLLPGPKPVKATAGGTGRSSRRPCAVPSLCSRPTNKPPCSSIWRPEAEIFSFTRTPPGNASFPHGPCRPNDAATPTARRVRNWWSRMPSGRAQQPGEAQVLRGIAALSRAEAAKPHQAEANRLRKLLLKLESEKKRLSDMVAGTGCRPPAPIAALPFFCGGKTRLRHAGRGRRVLSNPCPVDPRLTVRENMASLFHKASRGKRGLSMLEGRFATVQADLARAEQAGLMAQAATSAPTPANAPSPAAPQFRAPELPKNVQPFRSSDGFLLLRGRDAKGNAQLLKLAAPHDLWMHTGGGPGAHILIRRDHAAQEIPSRTISEAAILSVLKSWRKDETQVDVIAALAKFVHPIRGAKPGTVRIDRMEPAIIVTPDPSLEEKLAL